MKTIITRTSICCVIAKPPGLSSFTSVAGCFSPLGMALQGIWGMTHADVNKSGHTNDFKVVRMESVKEQELGLPVYPGNYQGYFKLTTGFQTET